MNKIALAMISRGTGKEVENLKRALQSIAPYVDGLYITLTGEKEKLAEAEKVCQEFNAHVSYYFDRWTADEKTVTWLREFFKYEPSLKVGDKLFVFDNARNFNFSQVSKDYEWITWIDTDDVLLKGENFRKIAERGMKEGIEGFYFNYIYQADIDEKGNIRHVIIEHLRERLVRNIGVYKWIAPIHETLIEQRPTRKIDTKECEVLHLANHADRLDSLTRNLKNLELSIYKSEGKDPRHIYYLAKAYFDLQTKEYNDKALTLMMKYLLGENPSGWKEERSQCWEYVAEIHRRKGNHDKSIRACMNALMEHPEQPSIFLNLAVSYMMKQEWERSMFWVKQASTIAEKQTTLVKNPKDLQARTLEVLYNACLNLNQIDKAWSAAVKLVEMFPNEQTCLNAYRFIDNLRTQRDLTMKFVDIANYLKQTGERPKIKALLASAPAILANNPFLINLYQQNNPPKFWEKNEIAIYCGMGFTPWSPKQLKKPNGTFVGGSEEAVIYMAEALSKLGWRVTIFNDCGNDEGVINNVTYLPYFKFNRNDNFNILIGWRDVRFFDYKFKAKQTYLWAHDLLNPLEFTQERLDKITRIIVLSKYHRECIPLVPDDKIFLSSNGIKL